MDSSIPDRLMSSGGKELVPQMKVVTEYLGEDASLIEQGDVED